jgi:hypothetical protein
MNAKTLTVILLVSLLSQSVRSQGMFLYDQQSADESLFLEGDLALGEQPLGQSFMPTLSLVGFVRFYISGGAFGGGTFVVNLRSDSITGTVLASTATVTLPAASGGFINFYFEDPVPVTPGISYYLQPVSLAGGGWGINAANFYNYAGGNAFYQGAELSNADLWFREGIVVPEPSATVLVLIGSGMLLYVRRSRSRSDPKI